MMRDWFYPQPWLRIPLVVAALVGCIALAVFVSPVTGIIALVGALLSLFILKNPWHGLYLLVFFLPFERLGSTDIGSITVRPSQVVALLTILSILFYYLGKHRFPLPANPTLIPLGLFVMISAIGFMSAPNLMRTTMVFAFVVFTMTISLIVPMLLKTEQQLEYVLRFLFASFAAVTLFGIYQWIGDWIGLPTAVTGLRDLYSKEILGFPRVQSTALEPLYFANYMLVPLGILMSLLITRAYAARDLFKDWHILVLLGLGGINLVLTVARGGYIAFAVTALLIIAYYFFSLRLLTPRLIAIGSGIGLLAIVIALQFSGIGEVAQQFLTHVVNIFDGASFAERAQTFEQSLVIWQLYPWFGIGPGSFGPYVSNFALEAGEHGWAIVNNQYLELLAEHGVLGLIAMSSVYLIVIIRSIKAVMRAQNALLQSVLIGTLAGFIGILVQYNTFSTLYIVHIWFIIGLLIALQNMVLARTTSEEHSDTRS